MPHFFVNLKRFDIPRAYGGICPSNNPVEWIETIIAKTIKRNIATSRRLKLVYLLPEGLVPAAINKLHALSTLETRSVEVGCQGVHWEDVDGGNRLGAFTSILPATAAKGLGCS